jgi:cellulose synthase/poly-beta-1,6-N-acetylglucosamine synthase-like glycosyltransferase
MPVRNEAPWIAQSLGAVLRQDYPASHMEIIVADGLSDDSTLDAIAAMPEAGRVRIISNPARIQAAGLNRALHCARGEVIVRVDGHTVIAPDYVRRAVTTMQASGAECVGGAIRPVGTNALGQSIAAASRSPFAIPAHFRVGTQPRLVDTVYMGAWKRSVFEQIGEFDETLAINEDYEFHYRLRRAGGRVYFTPELCSAYYGQETLSALARQYFRYGLWKPATLLKHPRSLRPRQIAAPALVLSIILCSILAIVKPELVAWCSLSIAIYALLSLYFTLRCGWGLRWSVALRLPWVFAVIHLSWGCGFWIGLFRQFTRRKAGNLP